MTVEIVESADAEDEDDGGGAVVNVAVLNVMMLVPLTPRGEQPTKSGALAFTDAQVWMSNSMASVKALGNAVQYGEPRSYFAGLRWSMM